MSTVGNDRNRVTALRSFEGVLEELSVYISLFFWFRVELDIGIQREGEINDSIVAAQLREGGRLSTSIVNINIMEYHDTPQGCQRN